MTNQVGARFTICPPPPLFEKYLKEKLLNVLKIVKVFKNVENLRALPYFGVLHPLLTLRSGLSPLSLHPCSGPVTWLFYYSQRPKSEHVRISDRGPSSRSNFCSVSNMSEIQTNLFGFQTQICVWNPNDQLFERSDFGHLNFFYDHHFSKTV